MEINGIISGQRSVYSLQLPKKNGVGPYGIGVGAGWGQGDRSPTFRTGG